MLLITIFSDFFNLFYPKTCSACGGNLIKNEEVLCTECSYDLPRIDLNNGKNPVPEIFWGRVKLENAFSFVQYQKGGKFQELIHQLKYRGKKEIGLELGKRFAKEISDKLDKVEIVVPVPLHWRKMKKRGYNQSEWIAKGIGQAINRPIIDGVLVREIENPTQTKKSRFERWENVDGIFTIMKKDVLKNKHVLLVDDVLTTGSTIEACARAILEEGNTKITVLTLGLA